MKFMKIITTFVISLLMTMPILADSQQPIHVVRFNDHQTGSEEDWLRGKGFLFREDLQRRDRINLVVSDGRLVIEARRAAFGLMTNESVNLPDFTSIEIDWGVNKFPEGASYERGIRNEAIMVLMFMGDERFSSGSFLIPRSPYFIGLYLCHGDDRIHYPYTGAYYKKTGRYVCGDRPAVGETVTTRFNILEAYRTYFDVERDDDPFISGLAIALDTKKASNDGSSSAFIKEVRIYR